MIDSGSLHIEINKRLGVLYNQHHQWLTAVAYNKSKDKQLSQDLVQDLYCILQRNKILKYSLTIHLTYYIVITFYLQDL